MDEAQLLKRLLEGKLPEFLQDLEILVNIDSGTYDKAGVDAVGRWLHTRLEEIGCAVEVFPEKGYGDSLLASLAGEGEARMLLVGHMDTVFPAGTAVERPFRLEGNRAKGPGVSDMKGGILAAFYALYALQEIGFKDFAALELFLHGTEEIGSPTARAWLEAKAKGVDAVLVLEAARANGDIVSARKGLGQYTLAVKGRAAHAGVEPERGRNAILELAHQVIALHALNDLSPGTTVNVGVVKGGIRPNVVPDFAQAQIDVRVVSLEGLAAIEKALAELTHKTTVPDVEVSLEGGMENPPMEKAPATARLVELAQRAAHELGFSLKDASTGGASDANFTAAAGAPTLDGLGPVGGLDHSPEEYLEVESIVPRTALLARLVQLIASEGRRQK